MFENETLRLHGQAPCALDAAAERRLCLLDLAQYLGHRFRRQHACPFWGGTTLDPDQTFPVRRKTHEAGPGEMGALHGFAAAPKGA